MSNPYHLVNREKMLATTLWFRWYLFLVVLIATLGLVYFATTTDRQSAQSGYRSGVWTWFNEARALRVANTSVIGAVNRDGDVVVHLYDHDVMKWDNTVTLHAGLEVDDHNNPSLLVRASDSRLMAFYCRHNKDSDYFMRVSMRPNDASAWNEEVNIGQQLGISRVSYANSVQLTGESSSSIFLFLRGDSGIGWGHYYSRSLDDGVTWSTAIRWLDNGSDRPYLKLARNGPDRIDFALTSGHPATALTNSVYHGYYQHGNLHQSDGTLVGPLNGGPYHPTDFTTVYDGTDNHAWIHEIVIDDDGSPRLGFATFPTTTDHRYHYARWNGAVWSHSQISTAGTHLYAEELYYSGGMGIDPGNVNVVYASRDTGDGVHQIWKYSTFDDGITWDAGTKLTANSDRSLRPFVVRGASDNHYLVYFTGNYLSYTDFDTVVVLQEG